MTDQHQADVHALRRRHPAIRVCLTLALVAGIVTLGAVTGAGEPVARGAFGTTQTADTADVVATSLDAAVIQQNATRFAEGFLEAAPVSRSSLITQLEFEGYATQDATWAVDQLSVDWYEQAAQSAASYLETMPFSGDGLIDQLVSEGFTQEQAEYGASQAGL